MFQPHSDPHAFQELALWNRNMVGKHILVHSCYLSDLTKVDIRRQVDGSNLVNDLIPFLNDRVVFNSLTVKSGFAYSETIAERVVFAVVDNKRCSLGQFKQTADFLGKSSRLGAYFKLVSYLQILFCIF
jgi:hypothetical protein